ncbi:MAG: GNAT family N-acetyltransferase [Hyphomicrobiales bacterium]
MAFAFDSKGVVSPVSLAGVSLSPSFPLPVTDLSTERLILRRWRACDLGPCAAMNRDPEVMRHYPQRLSRAETAVLIDRIEHHFDEQGFGFWVVQVKDGASFAGFVGLNRPAFAAPVTPCVEIGWRFARTHWGKGYATEAAAAVLDHAFQDLDLDEIVAFTVPANDRSRAVMKRLGMTRDEAGDFDHPWIQAGHPLRRHVLYRLAAREWLTRRI